MQGKLGGVVERRGRGLRALMSRPRREVSPEVSMDPRGQAEAPARQSVIDNAVYQNGHRVDSPRSLGATIQSLRARPGAMAWIGLYRPEESELFRAAEEFGLHELAVE